MTMNHFIIEIWFGDNLDDRFWDRVFTLSGKQVQLVTGDGCKIMIDSDAILQPIGFYYDDIKDIEAHNDASVSRW